MGAQIRLNGVNKGKKICKKLFLPRLFETIFEQKCSHLKPLLSITFPQGCRISKNVVHPTLGKGDKKRLKWYVKIKPIKKIPKKILSPQYFRPFLSKNVQIWDHFFPLLFPKDSESLKIIDIRLLKVGAKRRWNGTLKVNKLKKNMWKKKKCRGDFKPFLSKNYQIRLWEVGAKRHLRTTSKSEQTNTQTHRRTHRRTFQLIEKHWPGGQWFEKIICNRHSRLRSRTFF